MTGIFAPASFNNGADVTFPTTIGSLGQSIVSGGDGTSSWGSSSSSFSGLASGTNTSAAMVVGSGASISATGSGSIAATTCPAGGITGVLGVTYGGTGANLSSTGGTSQVLKQTSSGGNITVGQLAYADISGLGTLAEQNSGSINVTGGSITGLSAAINPSDVTILSQVQSLIATGIHSYLEVEALFNSNVAIGSPGSLTDGSYTIVATNRILLINQTAASQNGPWIYNSSSTPMTRPIDYTHGSTQTAGLVYLITETGSAYQGYQYVLNTATVTVDTTSTSWGVFSGPYSGSGPITVSGQVISLGTVGIPNGGTGLGTLAAHAVMLGEGTGNVGFATIGTAGRLLIDQGSGADPSFNAMSGDATIASDGAVTVVSTNGNDFTSASYTAIGTSGATIPLCAGTNTFSGDTTFSANAAASAPSVAFTGSFNVINNGSTNVPAILLQPSGTSAVTSWGYNSYLGTYNNWTSIGVNGPSGNGFFVDFHQNGGGSIFSVNSGGAIYSASSVTVTSTGQASLGNIQTTQAPYSAGTSTTCFPQWFANFGGTAVTNWSNGTNGGTVWGGNATGSWTGNWFDLHCSSNTSVFLVNYAGALTTAGAVTMSNYGSGIATFSSAGLISSTGTTGSGNVVLATSATLVTPALGTPASGVLTNCTGTASGLTAGVVSTISGLVSAGSNITISGSGTSSSPYTITASAASSLAFSALTGATNTTAAMVVGSGASLTTSGSGTITATACPASGMTGATLASGVTASSLTSVGTLTSLACAGAITDTQSIGVTSTDGLLLTFASGTPATVSLNQWSSRLHFSGSGWKTASTAGAQTVDVVQELQTVTGTSNPSGNWVLSAQVNAGGYSPILTVSTGGAATFAGNVTISTFNLVTDTSTGTKIGTSTSQKLGFFNATPVVQQTGDATTALSNLGLVTSATFAAASITGTTLASSVVASSLTSVGTLTSLACSGDVAFTGAGAASTSQLMINGTWYISGTSSTNYPALYVKASGVSDPNFSTSGESLVVNAPTSFGGNLLNLCIAGTSKFSISSGGGLTCVNVASSGKISSSSVPGASTSVFTTTGAPYAAGSGTTNFPQWFANWGGTAVTNWSNGTNNGTVWGINAASTFTGNYFDFHNSSNTSTFTLTSSGNVTAGTWQAALITGTYGGTGVNNGSNTITIGGNVTMSGAYTFAGTLTNTTAVTFPTSGTLVNTAVTALSSLVSVGTITTGAWNAGAVTSSGNIICGSSSYFGWGSTYMTSPTAATMQLGQADAASPVAQSLYFQNVVAGTANTSAANATLQNSLSTGTGTAGTLIHTSGFAGLSQNATVTLTIASPCVVTYTAHGFVPGQAVSFTTSGTLPTGITASVTYYVLATSLAANTFRFSATPGGSAINTSGSQSGTQTCTALTTIQNPASTIATWGPSGLTGSQAISVLSLAQTWNTTGNVNGLLLNVTNIASGASSNLLAIQVGGSNLFTVSTAGNVAASNLSLGGTLTTAAAATLSGAYSFTGTLTAATSVTFPTSGTLLTSASAAVTSAVAITGGTIDGTTIGGTTPCQAQVYSPVNAQTGTTYTFALSDNGTTVYGSNSSAQTYTIPKHTTTALPVGAEIVVMQWGSGKISPSGASGVTLNLPSGVTGSNGQYTAFVLKQMTTDTWVAFGNMA